MHPVHPSSQRYCSARHSNFAACFGPVSIWFQNWDGPAAEPECSHVGECTFSVHLTLAFCNVHPELSLLTFSVLRFLFYVYGYGHALEAAVIRFPNAFISVIVAALHLSLATACCMDMDVQFACGVITWLKYALILMAVALSSLL